MKKQLLITSSGKDECPTLHFDGSIDSKSDIYHPILVPTPPLNINIDLENLLSISDAGTRVWINWIYELFRTSSISIENVPFFFIERHNSISHFLPTGTRITSFKMKYSCINCFNSEERLLVDGKDYTLKSKFPSFKTIICSKCQNDSHPFISRAKELYFLSGNEQHRYQLLNNIKTAGVVIFDDKKRITFANESFSMLLNISHKRLTSNYLIIHDILKVSDPNLFCSKNGTLGMDAPYGPVPITINNKNEEISNLLISIAPDECIQNRWIISLENSSIDLLIKNKLPLSDRQNNEDTEEKIKQILQKPLTGQITEIDRQTETLTLSTFLAKLKSEIMLSKTNKRCFSVISIQIDFFGKIIEKYGQEFGDIILKNVASTINSFTRETDIIARTGKAKFSVIMPGTNIDGLSIVVNKLKRLLNKQIQKNREVPGEDSVTITASIGGISISEKVTPEIEPSYSTIMAIIDETKNNLHTAIMSGGNKSITTKMELGNFLA